MEKKTFEDLINSIWNYEDGNDTIELDGHFTIKELQIIIKHMNKSKIIKNNSILKGGNNNEHRITKKTNV